jgi:hypothetical protein
MTGTFVCRLCVLAALAFTGSRALAQAIDLTGTWIMDAERSGTKEGPAVVTLAQTDKELTFKVGSGENAPVMKYALDGTEHEFKPGVKTTAIWKGSKLHTTLVTTERGSESIVLSRDGEWLAAEVSHPEAGLRTWYFKRATRE